MNEEIEYAEMLEIPVSTVNVVRKKRSRARKVENPKQREPLLSQNADLKESVIAQVNDKLTPDGDSASTITADAVLFAEGANSRGNIDFDIPDRIDTVRLYSATEKKSRKDALFLQPENYDFNNEDFENNEGRYETNCEQEPKKRLRAFLGAEFAACCALCGAIFLTNVFMPGSAINTFFHSLEGKNASSIDSRTYSDFTLTPVVSELSDAELVLSPTGILSFTDECHVYPTANGKVSAVTQNADGTYTLKISHSDSFTGIIGGLNSVYYQVGDEVKANVPVGFSSGETEVQVTLYSDGELLNCFQLTEENCLAWVTEE